MSGTHSAGFIVVQAVSITHRCDERHHVWLTEACLRGHCVMSCGTPLTSQPSSHHCQLFCKQALKDACAALDADMRDPRSCGFDSSHSGTTACVALFAGSQLLVANTGAITADRPGPQYR